jgi:hypothetical protein
MGVTKPRQLNPQLLPYWRNAAAAAVIQSYSLLSNFNVIWERRREKSMNPVDNSTPLAAIHRVG